MAADPVNGDWAHLRQLIPTVIKRSETDLAGTM